MEILPLIPNTKRGFPPTVPLIEIVNVILYKLKTGVQWYQLSVKVLFEDNRLTWNAVYYHYRKKRKITNTLYLADIQGLPLAMSEPVAGNP